MKLIVNESLCSLQENRAKYFFHQAYRELRKQYYLQCVSRFRNRFLRLKGFDAIACPLKTIYVDPKNINYYITNYHFVEEGSTSPFPHFGKIVNGTWDKEAKHIEQHSTYIACKKRIMDNIPWSNIEESTSASVQEKENLLNSLKNQGYNESISPICCGIHIGRNGELIHGSNGRHRLFMSRLLGISEIPVRVIVRHKQWQTTRERFYATDSKNKPEDNLTGHPDLKDLV